MFKQTANGATTGQNAPPSSTNRLRDVVRLGNQPCAEAGAAWVEPRLTVRHRCRLPGRQEADVLAACVGDVVIGLVPRDVTAVGGVAWDVSVVAVADGKADGFNLTPRVVVFVPDERRSA